MLGSASSCGGSGAGGCRQQRRPAAAARPSLLVLAPHPPPLCCCRLVLAPAPLWPTNAQPALTPPTHLPFRSNCSALQAKKMAEEEGKSTENRSLGEEAVRKVRNGCHTAITSGHQQRCSGTDACRMCTSSWRRRLCGPETRPSCSTESPRARACGCCGCWLLLLWRRRRRLSATLLATGAAGAWGTVADRRCCSGCCSVFGCCRS